MRISKRNIILGMETALNGGSLSIIENQTEIDFVSGELHLSKSEDILLLLDKILSKNCFCRNDIKLIAVSNGPGSLTGIRIGAAIAKGLSNSLDVKVLEISVLEAMVYRGSVTGRIISALYTERSGVCFQEFIKNGNDLVSNGNIISNVKLNEYADEILLESVQAGKSVLLSEKLYSAVFERYSDELLNFKSYIHKIEGNFAKTIAIAADNLINMCV